MKTMPLLAVIFLVVACTTLGPDQVYSGKYAWGPEVNSFTPCNSTISYWVSYNWAGMEMHEYYKKNSGTPYQPMHIVFRGHLLKEVTGGFAKDYDGLIRISEVKAFSFDMPASCK